MKEGIGIDNKLREEYLQEAYKLLERRDLKTDYLQGKKVWISASRRDPVSQQLKLLYSNVLTKLGIEILDYTFKVIINARIEVDLILMFTFTPGISARAIEVVVMSEVKRSTLKDKLCVYMPEEFKSGHICRRIGKSLIAGKLYYEEQKDLNNLDVGIFSKCIKLLINTIMDREQEMKVTFKPKIAIITALPKEFNMMKSFFSVENIRHDPSFGDDKASFPHGCIGSNDVVLAVTGAGNNFSTAIATKIYEKYRSIKYTFMVGIAGGIPDLDDPVKNVNLGDIVICGEKGVVQYDNIKAKSQGENEPNHPPRPPNATLLRNVMLHVDDIGKQDYEYWDELDKLLKEKGVTRPGETICDGSYFEDKNSVSFPQIPDGYNAIRPRVHFGTIASANTVVKDKDIRDTLKNIYKAKAIEKEASGVADASWLQDKTYFVVRGICDYADSNKNDVWQEYAAAAAAAFTSEIIKITLP